MREARIELDEAYGALKPHYGSCRNVFQEKTDELTSASDPIQSNLIRGQLKEAMKHFSAVCGAFNNKSEGAGRSAALAAGAQAAAGCAATSNPVPLAVDYLKAVACAIPSSASGSVFEAKAGIKAAVCQPTSSVDACYDAISKHPLVKTSAKLSEKHIKANDSGQLL